MVCRRMCVRTCVFVWLEAKVGGSSKIALANFEFPKTTVRLTLCVLHVNTGIFRKFNHNYKSTKMC